MTPAGSLGTNLAVRWNGPKIVFHHCDLCSSNVMSTVMVKFCESQNVVFVSWRHWRLTISLAGLLSWISCILSLRGARHFDRTHRRVMSAGPASGSSDLASYHVIRTFLSDSLLHPYLATKCGHLINTSSSSYSMFTVSNWIDLLSALLSTYRTPMCYRYDLKSLNDLYSFG